MQHAANLRFWQLRKTRGQYHYQLLVLGVAHVRAERGQVANKVVCGFGSSVRFPRHDLQFHRYRGSEQQLLNVLGVDLNRLNRTAQCL